MATSSVSLSLLEGQLVTVYVDLDAGQDENGEKYGMLFRGVMVGHDYQFIYLAPDEIQTTYDLIAIRKVIRITNAVENEQEESVKAEELN